MPRCCEGERIVEELAPPRHASIEKYCVIWLLVTYYNGGKKVKDAIKYTSTYKSKGSFTTLTD